MEKLETVIGLEIHVELKTASKMFCSCKNDSMSTEPNINVCPTCMGMVGTLPLLNKRAFEQTVHLASALKSTISRHTKWDRKSYFYPDLPKGFQISQFDLPIGQGGEVFFPFNNTLHSVRMTRVHLEEDAAKSVHGVDKTFIDFNRSSVPLVEMVTEPDLRSAEEAKALLKAIRRLVKDLGISDADMEKGQMRCDASISLRKFGEEKLYSRVEIKNLNSFRSVESALKYQEEKLKIEWQSGTYPEMASTVLWNDERMATYPMRTKETAADYRYFPEPDIPVVKLSEEAITCLTKDCPRLRKDEFSKLIEEGVDIIKLLSLLDSTELFWSFADLCKKIESKEEKDLALNFYITEVPLLFETYGSIPFSEDEMLLLIKKVNEGIIPVSTAKKFLSFCKKNNDLAKCINDFETLVCSEKVDLSQVVTNVLSKNTSLVNQYLVGEEKVLQAFIGLVMRETKGMFSGREISDTIHKTLEAMRQQKNK